MSWVNANKAAFAATNATATGGSGLLAALVSTLAP
ncbi:uncharacterized protein METZ01_LOCUS337217 [marine metagenome]|uniref:Uncharacterized protein n=1 Tax=marine metagenome TaxID=408172 RepID=A0A382QFP9_9ZZZZ